MWAGVAILALVWTLAAFTTFLTLPLLRRGSSSECDLSRHVTARLQIRVATRQLRAAPPAVKTWYRLAIGAIDEGWQL